MFKYISSKNKRWFLAVNVFPKSAMTTGNPVYCSGIHTRKNRFENRLEMYFVIRNFRVIVWIPLGRVDFGQTIG